MDPTSTSTDKRLFLSQELIDIIVDHTHNDRSTLLNCSLASRLFLSSSRFHLFERLHLQFPRWAHFFDLLESPLSTIAHVRFIRLDFEDNDTDLFAITTRLHGLRLHSLSLANMRIEQCIDLDGEIIGFGDLKQLTVTRGYFPNPSHMFDIMSKFKCVEHLCLRLPSFNRNLAGTSADHHLSVTHSSTVLFWRILELHCWGFQKNYASFAWLTTHPDISALHTVTVTGLEELEDFVSVGKFLQTLGPQLKYLELELPSMLKHFENHFDLSLNNNLQCIHIILPDFVGVLRRIHAASCQALSSYACILSQIMSPSLCEVVLSEGPETQSQVIDMALLPGVVSALKGRQFAHVRRVVFPPLLAGPHAEAREYLKAELSEWDRRGVLVFEDSWGYFGRWVYDSER